MSSHNAGSKAPPIHVATVNVRYDGRRDHPVPIPETGVITPSRQPHNEYGEQPWAVRRSRLVDALLSMGHLDIIGFQEVYKSQLLDLSALLGPRFGNVGVGRDDGKEAGEYSPIFYDKDRFELVNWKTIWLSTKPNVPGSIGWDAGQTRIATLLSLRDRQGGKSFVHAVCTHYDDRGIEARAKSSLLIRTAVAAWVGKVEGVEPYASWSPVILFGDFNSPDSEGGYKNITSKEPLADGYSYYFLDAFTNLLERNPKRPGVQSRPYGPLKTYTGFAGPGAERTTRIDFILLAGPYPHSIPDYQDRPGLGRGGWSFTQYAVIDNWVEEGDESGWEGRWSDHRAVRATLEHV